MKVHEDIYMAYIAILVVLPYNQGSSRVGTRGNGVPIPIFGVGTRSHTFLH